MKSSINRRVLSLTAVGIIGLLNATFLTPARGESDNANGGANAAPVAASLDVRFSGRETTEVPDFQKHVIPLIGRLGCNGRACHGSFQGRGGFQLSLFGYDFAADHAAMLDESSGRVDVDDIDESLILVKPLDADVHEGGKRFDEGSWQHHVLRRWIESGAKNDSKVPKHLKRLEIIPDEIQFTSEGQRVPLQAIAHWEDGTVEDVTPLCRFSSNDDAIAEINEDGQVRSSQQGDTHVVVYYDNAVIPVPVLRPVSNQLADNIEQPSHPIDRLVLRKLGKLGIEPSGICTDAEFIRRVSLDMTGILPSAEEVRAFLADPSEDKRERLVHELLESPGYAAWWATRFSDWTGNNDEQLNNALPIRNAATRLWYEWLRTRLDNNMPYDKIIEGIVTAQSRQPNEDYLEYCKSMTEACSPGNEHLFAERDGLPLFWARRNFQSQEDRAIGFAYTFLGVRIECAQCHKHPFDQWSKDDFEQFAKIFTPIRANQNLVAPDAKEARDTLVKEITGDKKLKGGDLRRAIYEAAREGKTVPFAELTVDTRLSAQNKRRAAQAKKRGKQQPVKLPTGKILGQPEAITLDKDPRGELMDWLRSPENPYFAKAIVNRVWSNYFGVGIVDPTDDMNLANPPVNAPLLDYLATEFVKHDFDLKWLHHTIVTSDTYQRSALPNDTNVMDRTNFSRHIPRRLPAEVVYDAVILATGSDEHASRLRRQLDEMAIADGKPRRRNQQEFALEVFGQSIRETNCDCDRSDAPSLLQSIYLRNDTEMHKRLADKDGWVAQACKLLGVAGPSSADDPAALANQRRAESMRKQLIARITRLTNLPEKQQRRMRPQVKQEYARVSERMEQYGYQVPPLNRLIEDVDSWNELDAKPQPQDAEVTINSLVEEAYLRTLSRFPDEEEAAICLDFIHEAEAPAKGVESLLWALVNTKEFIITH